MAEKDQKFQAGEANNPSDLPEHLDLGSSNSFSLEKALNAEKMPYQLLEFVHFNVPYTVRVKICRLKSVEQQKLNEEVREYSTTLVIEGKESKQQEGRLQGVVTMEGEQFISFVAVNDQRQKLRTARTEEEKESIVVVPGIVLEALAQILLHHVFKVWQSSIHQSDGGDLLYQKLMKRADIIEKFKIESVVDSNGNSRWTFTAK